MAVRVDQFTPLHGEHDATSAMKLKQNRCDYIYTAFVFRFVDIAYLIITVHNPNPDHAPDIQPQRILATYSEPSHMEHPAVTRQKTKHHHHSHLPTLERDVRQLVSCPRTLHGFPAGLRPVTGVTNHAPGYCRPP